jgi:hypothetical protein
MYPCVRPDTIGLVRLGGGNVVNPGEVRLHGIHQEPPILLLGPVCTAAIFTVLAIVHLQQHIAEHQLCTCP